MLTRDQAISEIRAAKCDPERLSTLVLPDDQDARRYLFDVCSIEHLAQALFVLTKDQGHWARFRLDSFALGGMVLVSKDMCDWERTRHEWALRPGWKGVGIWEEKAKGEGWAEEHYEAPRKALEAKGKWLRGEIGDEELRKAWNAVYAAAEAADAVYAAAEAAYYAAASVYYAAYYAAAYASGASGAADDERDRWYLDYLRFLLETCNKDLLR